MASKDIQKNQRDVVRISPTRYADLDLVDIRVFTPNKDTKELMPTKKGVSVQVDLIPELIEGLIWALGQPCAEGGASVERELTAAAADQLAESVWEVLRKHGSAIHWDSIERMVLRSGGNKSTKWDLHYVLATRKDLFERGEPGCYRAKDRQIEAP
jgi:hypothetical protein